MKSAGMMTGCGPPGRRHRRGHRRAGDRPGAAPGPAVAAASSCSTRRTGSPGTRAGATRASSTRASTTSPARKGPAVRGRPGVDGRVLPRAGHPPRGLRQARGRGHPRRDRPHGGPATSGAWPTACPSSAWDRPGCATSSRTWPASRRSTSRVTGIVDYGEVSAALAEDLRADGVEIRTGVAVRGGRARAGGVDDRHRPGPARRDDRRELRRPPRRPRSPRPWGRRRGRHPDRPLPRRVLRAGRGGAPTSSAALIYPVPDPRFPFLGVHLTKGIGGHVHAGPNAVLGAGARGLLLAGVDRHDLAETLRFSGFRRLARRYWRYGLHETVRSLSSRRSPGPCSASCRRCGGRTCGGRRPASAPRRSSRTGTWPTTSCSARTGRCSTCSTPRRPAATASLEIGRVIAERLVAVDPLIALRPRPDGPPRPEPGRLAPNMPRQKPTPPTLVLLVRHGQTPTTGTHLPGRAPGLHLSDEGQRQAEPAAKRIAELDARRRRLRLAPRAGPGDRGADRQAARA